MKYLMILLLMIVTISSFGQSNKKNNSSRKWDKYDNLDNDSIIKPNSNFVSGTDTPGKCLIKSSGSTIGSLFCMVIGSGVITYSFNKEVEKDAESLRIVGGVILLTGAILEIRGIILIGKAGKLMEKERQKSLSYNISPTKFGLAFNF